MGDRLRARLLTALAGEPGGAPAWVRELAVGGDAGYFPEDGAAWTVHGGMPTMVAGIRSLLLQALHPGAMAGVHDWSRYRQDPLGRLTGTVRWVVCTTYGSTVHAQQEAARVSRLHARVQGGYLDGLGRDRTYTAHQPELVEWVHLTFTDSFLVCQQTWGTRRRGHAANRGGIPGGADAYVAEWAAAGRLMGVTDPPTTEAELRRRLDDHLERGELRGDERVQEVVSFLRRPPERGVVGLGYRLLFAGAVATIPRRYRRLLGLRRSPLPVVTGTRIVLAIAGRVLASGDGKSAQDWARQRLRRLSVS